MGRDFYKTDLEILKCNRVKGNTEKEFRKKLLYITICSNENYQRQSKEFDVGVVKLTLNGLSDDLYKFSAKKYRLSKSVISNYLTELVDEGLLEVIQKGSNNNNSASFYRITTYKKNRTDIETENRTQNRTDKQSDFNGLEDNTRTDTKTDTETESWNSKKELIKRINKNIYTEIFDYWISKGVYKHREFTKNMENAIERTLKDYTLEQIKEAIDNYSEMYKSDYKYCSYKWTLIEFLTRTQDKTNERQLELHLKEGVSYKRYLEYKSKAKDPVEEKTNLEIIDGYEYETV